MTIEMIWTPAEFERIQEIVKRLSPKAASSVIPKAFRAGVLTMERALRITTSGRYLKKRTGRLANSVGSITSQRGADLTGVVGSGVGSGGNRVPYATILETGGTITPKSGRFLAVPLPAAKTAAGVVKARYSSNLIGGLRSLKNTFVSKGIIFEKRTKRGRPVPLFALRRSVTIPRFRYMELTVQHTADEVMRIMRDSVNKTLEARA